MANQTNHPQNILNRIPDWMIPNQIISIFGRFFILGPTVDGCEILHHQTDGWNMLKPYIYIYIYTVNNGINMDEPLSTGAGFCWPIHSSCHPMLQPPGNCGSKVTRLLWCYPCCGGCCSRRLIEEHATAWEKQQLKGEKSCSGTKLCSWNLHFALGFLLHLLMIWQISSFSCFIFSLWFVRKSGADPHLSHSSYLGVILWHVPHSNWPNLHIYIYMHISHILIESLGKTW